MYWTGAEFCLVWYFSLACWRYMRVILSCSNSASSVLLKCNFQGATSRIFVRQMAFWHSNSGFPFQRIRRQKWLFRNGRRISNSTENKYIMLIKRWWTYISRSINFCNFSLSVLLRFLLVSDRSPLVSAEMPISAGKLSIMAVVIWQLLSFALCHTNLSSPSVHNKPDWYHKTL